MGVVYEGEHVRIRKRVAIKCLHAQFAKNPDVLARFHREALAATAIGNEHIVEVTDLDRLADGTVFLVLEYLDGRDLGHDLDERGRLSVTRAVHIVSQMCEALAVAHDKGIVHRDIKPDNVYLITRGGDPDFVKILDFGISKFRDMEEDGAHGVTDTGSMLGTPLYMAPEQFSDTKTVDRRADIYALGGILFHALAGRTAFRGKTLSALIGEVMHGAPPDLRAHRPDLPESLARVVHRMLARKPEERFDDCDAVRIALRPFAGFAERPALLVDSLVELRDAPAAPNVTPASLLFGDADGATSADPAPPVSATSGTGASPSTSLFLQSVKVRPRWLLPAAGGLALAAVLGLALGSRARGTTPVPPGPPVPVTPLALAPATPPVPAPTPAVAAAATQDPASAVPAAVVRGVRIRIRSTPPDAELYFDSHRMMNPFDGELPADVRPHRLEARRTGYRAVVIPDLVLEFPQNVEIPMTRGSGEERRATRPPSVRGNGPAVVVAAPVAERPEPVAPPPATPPTPAAAPMPPPVETPAPFVPPPPAIRDPL
nr:serine/threonine protein kinase [Deltaproteobacteria bacterium]